MSCILISAAGWQGLQTAAEVLSEGRKLFLESESWPVTPFLLVIRERLFQVMLSSLQAGGCEARDKKAVASGAGVYLGAGGHTPFSSCWLGD